MNSCKHNKIKCINPYEYIRKYKCEDCLEIMMCECEKFIGEKFLSHQLNTGIILETKERVKVTLGFVKSICPECRGEIPINAPIAKIHDRTSKIQRYYWREIFFETCKQYYDETGNLELADGHSNRFEEIRKQVIKNIQVQHEVNPKYTYLEVSQEEIIKKNNIELITKKVEHVKDNEKKIKINDNGILKEVEDYAGDCFRKQGYQILKCESRPFHVLFAVFFWQIIQDYSDLRVRNVFISKMQDHFIERAIYEVALPEDFGAIGYYPRRKNEILMHIQKLNNIEQLFEQWLIPSFTLRIYLWAYEEESISRARKILQIFSINDIKKILLYLIESYWENYVGWPDLLVYNEKEFFFVEVKSSSDKLCEDQKHWIIGNFERLKFKYKIFKTVK